MIVLYINVNFWILTVILWVYVEVCYFWKIDTSLYIIKWVIRYHGCNLFLNGSGEKILYHVYIK